MQFADMSIEDIVKECLEDSEKWFPDRQADLGYLTICIAGEVGEFANLVKKGMRGSFDPEDEGYQRALAFELTDVFIYLMNIAGLMNLDLEKMYQVKRELNNERFGSPESNGSFQ